MVLREEYLAKLDAFQDKNIIKVVTGVRRCGKSTLLKQFQERLLSAGKKQEQIIAINLEALEYEALLDYHALYNYIVERLCGDCTTYIFLDEIQLVDNFQKIIDSLYIKDNVDIYVTGSNAKMLSGELATLLSGRYIEIKMLPLSLKEYALLTNREKGDAFVNFFYNGGFPYGALLNDKQYLMEYLEGVYNTIVLKDIVARKKVQDVELLKSIIKFLLNNIGNIVSSNKIASTLTSMGRKTSPLTVESYLNALQDCFVLYKASRYDLRGKQLLQSLEKYYVVDIGFRTLLLGNKGDIGHILENIVYIELLRRGYQVFVGKFDELEVDFVAVNMRKNETIYYQVTASVLDSDTYKREMLPLQKIKDNYPKYIITMDPIATEEAGIKQINVVDFLMSANVWSN